MNQSILIYQIKITWAQPIWQSCYHIQYQTWYLWLPIHQVNLTLSYYLVFDCRYDLLLCRLDLDYFLRISTISHHNRLLWTRPMDSSRKYGCRVYMLSFASDNQVLFWLCSRNHQRNGLDWGRRLLDPCRLCRLPSWFYSILIHSKVYGRLRDLWLCLRDRENFSSHLHWLRCSGWG